MNVFRRVPTVRLLSLIGVAVAALGATVGVALALTGGPTPPPAALADAVHGALTASAPAGVSAQIHLTSELIDSSLIAGSSSSPLLSGGDGRLWWSPGHLRIELQSGNGDTEIVLDGRSAELYDSAHQVLYELTLPARPETGATGHDGLPARPDTGVTGHDHAGQVPSVAEIQSTLDRLTQHADVSGPTPTNVGGAPAYSVRVSPKASGGLIGGAELAWAAANGVPLRIGVCARGSSASVLELALTDVSFTTVAASTFDLTPVPGTKIVRIATGGDSTRTPFQPPAAPMIESLPAGGTLSFHTSIPDSLAGLTRTQARTISWNGKQALALVYGSGLGAIVVIERAGDTSKQQPAGTAAGGLPTLSLGNGVTAGELPTALGTVISFSRGGTSFVVAASEPRATVEQATRRL